MNMYITWVINNISIITWIGDNEGLNYTDDEKDRTELLRRLND